MSGNIETFLSELNALKEKMNRGNNELPPEAKYGGLKKQLFEYQQKEKQMQEEIEREIEDFFSYMHMKKASIEVLNGLGEYVRKEISRLEGLIQAEKTQ